LGPILVSVPSAVCLSTEVRFGAGMSVLSHGLSVFLVFTALLSGNVWGQKRIFVSHGLCLSELDAVLLFLEERERDLTIAFSP